MDRECEMRKKIHLVTMPIDNYRIKYHGVVELDDNGYVYHDSDDEGTPIEDYGCYYYTPEDEPFPTDEEWLFKKFLSFIHD